MSVPTPNSNRIPCESNDIAQIFQYRDLFRSQTLTNLLALNPLRANLCFYLYTEDDIDIYGHNHYSDTTTSIPCFGFIVKPTDLHYVKKSHFTRKYPSNSVDRLVEGPKPITIIVSALYFEPSKLPRNYDRVLHQNRFDSPADRWPDTPLNPTSDTPPGVHNPYDYKAYQVTNVRPYSRFETSLLIVTASPYDFDPKTDISQDKGFTDPGLPTPPEDDTTNSYIIKRFEINKS